MEGLSLRVLATLFLSGFIVKLLIYFRNEALMSLPFGDAKQCFLASTTMKTSVYPVFFFTASHPQVTETKASGVGESRKKLAATLLL